MKCEDCFYYSKTRYGVVCSYDGTYNPKKKSCPRFKPRVAEEERLKANIELEKLILSLIDDLAKLQPDIDKLENGALKDKLKEICLVAKQIKKSLES